MFTWHGRIRAVVTCAACLVLGAICIPGWILHFPYDPDLPAEPLRPAEPHRAVAIDWQRDLSGRSRAEVEELLNRRPVKFLTREEAEKALWPRKLNDEPNGREIGALGRWVTEREELVVIFNRRLRVMRVITQPLP